MSSGHEYTNGNHERGGLPRVPSIPLSDDAAIEAGEHQSIGSLVRDATIQVSTLVRAEIELARTEIASEVRKGLVGSVYFIVALTILLLALPFVFVAAALGINKGLWDWAQPWGGFFIMFFAMLLIAGLFALLGGRKVRAIRAPERTISSMKDTAATLAARGDNGHEVATVRRG